MPLKMKEYAAKHSNISDKFAIVPKTPSNPIPEENLIDFHTLSKKEKEVVVGFMNLLDRDLGDSEVVLVNGGDCIFSDEDSRDGYTGNVSGECLKSMPLYLVEKGRELYPPQYHIVHTAKNAVPSPMTEQFVSWEVVRESPGQSQHPAHPHPQLSHLRDVLAEVTAICFMANTKRLTSCGVGVYFIGGMYSIPDPGKDRVVNLTTGNVCNYKASLATMGSKGREVIFVEYLGDTETYLDKHHEKKEMEDRLVSYQEENAALMAKMKDTLQKKVVERDWVLKSIGGLFQYLDALEAVTDESKRLALKQMVIRDLERAVSERVTDIDGLL